MVYRLSTVGGKENFPHALEKSTVKPSCEPTMKAAAAYLGLECCAKVVPHRITHSLHWDRNEPALRPMALAEPPEAGVNRE
jgi:hypothetical protein